MARLTIEHDAGDDDANARTRRRSIALRLDGMAWLRVEPKALGELGVAEGDEIDDPRRTSVEEALARVRARLFVVRSLAMKMQSAAEIEKKLAARDVPPQVARQAIERVKGYGYIDDASLAGQLARGMQARGYGRRRAEQKLSLDPPFCAGVASPYRRLARPLPARLGPFLLLRGGPTRTVRSARGRDH